jgi:hypothetical protein
MSHTESPGTSPTTSSRNFHASTSQIIPTLVLPQHSQQTYLRGEQLRQFCEFNLKRLIPLSDRLDETLTYWYKQNFKQYPILVMLQKGPFYWIRIVYHRCVYLSKKYLWSFARSPIDNYYYDSSDMSHSGNKLNHIISARQDINHTLYELQKWARLNAELIGILSQCSNESMKSSNDTSNRTNSLLNEMVLFFQLNKKYYVNSTILDSSGYMMISQCGKLIDEHVCQLQNHVLPMYKKPHHLTRNWIKYALLLSIGAYATYKAMENRDKIMSWIAETYNTAYRFYYLHLQEPLVNMYQVIRYDTHKQLVDPESVDVSVSSLERMVTMYALKHGSEMGTKFTKEELDLIASQARRGNLEYIMRQYEKEMAHPIKNALFGDMAQLLLIQIQKQKADIERTMVQIDKLIQSNELNFELMATIPFILLSAFIMYNVLTYRRKTDVQIILMFKSKLIKLEKVLNRLPNDLTSVAELDSGHLPETINSNNRSINPSSEDIDEARIPYNFNQACGFVYIYLTSMKNMLNNNLHKFQAHYRKEDSILRDLSYDLTELGDHMLTPSQRLRTIERMYRSYIFLGNDFVRQGTQ